VAVAGCGLGHDAREVIRRGYEVTAFDVSAAAIRWARSLDPDHASSYVQADLFKVPARWMRRFDLVVDSNNLNYFAPGNQQAALAALAAMLAPHGHLLVVCAGAAGPSDAEEGSPWPLSERQLREAASLAGLAAQGPVACFSDDEGQLRLRAVFQRA
jgi:SAM-dependent methyltransferase